MNGELVMQVQDACKSPSGTRWLSDLQLAGLIEHLFGVPWINDFQDLTDAQGAQLVHQLELAKAQRVYDGKVKKAIKEREARHVA